MNSSCFIVFWLSLMISQEMSLSWVPPYMRSYFDRSISSPISRSTPCCNTPLSGPLELPPMRYGEGSTLNQNYAQNSAKLLQEFIALRNENYGKIASRQNTNYANVKMSSPTDSNNNEKDRQFDNKALKCSKLQCLEEEIKGPLCACNFKTGNTVSFKNECDIKKHNCRFDTEFRTILHEVCPWEFESRSGFIEGDDESIKPDVV